MYIFFEKTKKRTIFPKLFFLIFTRAPRIYFSFFVLQHMSPFSKKRSLYHFIYACIFIIPRPQRFFIFFSSMLSKSCIYLFKIFYNNNLNLFTFFSFCIDVINYLFSNKCLMMYRFYDDSPITLYIPNSKHRNM